MSMVRLLTTSAMVEQLTFSKMKFSSSAFALSNTYMSEAVMPLQRKLMM